MTVSLEGDAKKQVGEYEGSYIYDGNINGKIYWLKTDEKQAIWYYPEYKEWAFGKKNNLGKKWRFITGLTTTDTTCPNNASTWKYWNGDIWITTNDPQFSCEGRYLSKYIINSKPCMYYLKFKLIILDVECCLDIKVTLKDDVLRYQGRYAGIYKKQSDLINDKNYWTSEDNKTALWFYVNYNAWILGPIANLGSEYSGYVTAGIASNFGPFCPTKHGMKWSYYSSSNKITPENSFQIDCIDDL